VVSELGSSFLRKCTLGIWDKDRREVGPVRIVERESGKQKPRIGGFSSTAICAMPPSGTLSDPHSDRVGVFCSSRRTPTLVTHEPWYGLQRFVVDQS